MCTDGLNSTISALFVLSLLLHSSDLYFVTVGPCSYPRQITCPDPHINFYLYTSANRNEPQRVDSDKDAIVRSHFKAGKINKVIIHGYATDPNVPGVQEIKDAYLNAGRDYNVWMVSYKALTRGPYACFPMVVASLNHIGACVAQFVQSVQSASPSEYQDLFHVIGFSLGAHVSAYTAKHLQPYILPRITALDPASSVWVVMDVNKERIQKTHANFVDVIHTDAMVTGKSRRCGHVDFYVNGGLKQPGCENKNLRQYSNCNHKRAIRYFAESITSKEGFWGYPCPSSFHYLLNKCPPTNPHVILMGEYCAEIASGFYVVPTAAQDPFAIGRNFIRENPSSSQPET